MQTFKSGKTLIQIDETKKVCTITSPSRELGVELLKQKIKNGIKDDFRGVVYQPKKDSGVIELFAGDRLDELLGRDPSLKKAISKKLKKKQRVQAAGILIFCGDSRRFLLQQRSETCSHPLKWGLYGGVIEQGETPLDTVTRECFEEGKLRFNDPCCIIELTHYRGPELTYFNHLCVVNKEVEPVPNDEVASSAWVSMEDLAKFDLVPGVEDLLREDPTVKQLIEAPTDPEFDYAALVDKIIADATSQPEPA